MSTSTDVAADVRDQAIHVLRTSGIVYAYERLNSLDKTEAGRAVAALAAAGLLRDVPPIPTPPTTTALTLTAAQAVFDQRRNELKSKLTIASVGTVRLQRCTASRAFLVTSHRGEHYKGDDLADAVAAYNAATLR